MVFPLAAAITAGGSLLGGLFAGQGQAKGGKMAAKATLKANQQNLKYQMKFAKRGLRWKINDAKKAGIAPLAALGAVGQSFSPSFVGATQAGQGVADAAASMGQGISRAATALGDADSRNAEYVAQLQKLQLDNMALQNQALGSQIRIMSQPGNPPAAPVAADRYLIPGQGSSVDAGTDYQPNKLVQKSERAGFDPGTMNDMATIATQDGSQVIVPSKDAKAATEDNLISETQMAIRHNVDILNDPRKFWRGPISADENVTYNPFTGRLSKYRIPESEKQAREYFTRQLNQESRYRNRSYGRGTPTNSGFHGFE